MKKIAVMIIFVLVFLNLNAEERQNIYSLLNKEIFISDGFAGQSITLIKESDKYYIIRTYFGSGVPVISKVKYSVDFTSDHQLRFSRIIEGRRPGLKENIQEEFILTIIEKNKIQLLLNGIMVAAELK